MKMKIIVLLCSLAVAFAADNSWETFKVTHNKRYSSVQEEAYRKAIFERNLKYIEEHNSLFAKGESTFSLGINKFADMTNEEFRDQMTGLEGVEIKREKVLDIFPEVKSVPDSIDWREKGAVTPVKNQGEIGDSWPFSAVAPLEGAWFIKTGQLIDMSEQQIYDCAWTDDFGVGWVQGSYEYVMEVGGIDGEDAYFGKNATECGFDPDGIVANVTGYIDIPVGNETALAEAVYNAGPVSVAVDASGEDFQFYHSGIFYDSECTQTYLIHAMTIVGYGNDGDRDYWIVKNSFGESWGEGGYIRMTRNNHNNCGIATNSCYPTV